MKFPMDECEVPVANTDKELISYKEKRILFNIDDNEDLTLYYTNKITKWGIWKTI